MTFIRNGLLKISALILVSACNVQTKAGGADESPRINADPGDRVSVAPAY